MKIGIHITPYDRTSQRSMKIGSVVGKAGRFCLQLLLCGLIGWPPRPADRPSMAWLPGADVLVRAPSGPILRPAGPSRCILRQNRPAPGDSFSYKKKTDCDEHTGEATGKTA